MGRIRQRKNPDRYLASREGNYYYKRRVPTALVAVDPRGEHVRISLKTDDLAQARAMRDIYESADDEYWASLTVGVEADGARTRYLLAVRRAQAMGFTYRPAHDIALKESVDAILQRIETAVAPQAAKPVVGAVMGTLDEPAVKLSEAFTIYRDEIVPDELVGKSKGQKAKWENIKQRAVDNFVAVAGDLRMDEIGRDDARKIYQHWLEKIAPKGKKPTHVASSGNRILGGLRVIYRSYFAHLGDPDRQNPFAGLNFAEKKTDKKRRKRPPFQISWITGKLLAPGALAGLNAEARGIFLAVVETGARPAEICNLTAAHIVLDHEVPHLTIEPRDDPEDPREIKTASSIRAVPLIGVSLAAMKKFPNGFPRYKDKESSFSATMNKYLTENELRQTPKHTTYSLRHSFEDRMKDVGIDSELRMMLMGHTVDRPDYGEGGSLQWRQRELKKIMLPFDPSIV